MSYKEENDHVCRNYVLLKPKEATLAELIRLLFYTDLSKRSFVECSEEEGRETRDFRRRWLIFISIVAQKLLFLLRKPLALLGYVLVSSLNLVAANGGFLGLFINFSKGELARADPSSYASILGNLDPRMDLGTTIKPDSEKYLGSLSIMASKLAYENEDFIKNIVHNHWQMHFLGFYNFWNGYLEKPSTQAFMLQDREANPKLIVLAFRGTDPFDADAWSTDVDISWYELENIGKTHRGFAIALGLQQDNAWPAEIANAREKHFAYYEIKKMLKAMLRENEGTKFIVTGHSLGGASAILFVAGLAIHDEAFLMARLEGVYTFGQPRVGDERFGTFMKEKLRHYNVKYMRYVYSYDIVPRVPYDDKTLFFKHFGPCLYFTSFYKGKILPEEPDKNYFSLRWFVPKHLNALWELIRGFILPYIKGMEYKEGWLLRAYRLLGLVAPGLAAHSPFDYVNLCRLGSLPSIPGLKHTDPSIFQASTKFD